MKKVIKIGGYARCGKDTSAEIMKGLLEQAGLKVEIIAYADELKEIASQTLGISVKQLDELKNEGHYIVSDSVTLSIRAYLINLSTSLKERYGEDFLCKETNRRILESKADVILIPDWRFPYEHIKADDIKVYEVLVQNMNVNRIPDINYIARRNKLSFDYIINNNGDKYDLQDDIIRFLWRKQIIYEGEI